MILLVEKEKDIQLEKLVKENELIAKQLETVENAISELDLQIQQREDKLDVVDKKCERIIAVKKQLFERDNIIKAL